MVQQVMMTCAGLCVQGCKRLLLKVTSFDLNTVSQVPRDVHIYKIMASMWGAMNAEREKHYSIVPIASKTTYDTVEQDVGVRAVFAKVWRMYVAILHCSSLDIQAL